MGNQCVDVEAHCSLHQGAVLIFFLFFFCFPNETNQLCVFWQRSFWWQWKLGAQKFQFRKPLGPSFIFFSSKWLISPRHQGEAGRLKSPITRLSLNSTCSWTHLALLGCIDVRAYTNMGQIKKFYSVSIQKTCEKSICVYVCLILCGAYVCVATHGGQKRALDSLQLELQAIACCSIWVLRASAGKS